MDHEPKIYISNIVKAELKTEGLTQKNSAEAIDNFSKSQLIRIPSPQNYNIDTLIKLLGFSQLEIILEKKH